jgi:MerR family mercuric resistance operon transcriptional regulator
MTTLGPRIAVRTGRRGARGSSPPTTTTATNSYKIGDVSRITGLSIDTVRFYEKQGLLGPVRRRAGIRQYGEDAVRRLDFVRRATALGFTLAEIRGLLGLRVSSRTSCEKVRERALVKLEDVERRIAELECVRDALVALADTCAHTTGAACPFLDALDERSRS